MITMKGFNKHILRISGGNKGRIALIVCYDDKSFIGRIDFYPDNEELPDDYLWHPKSSEGHIILHMPVSRLETVLSIIKSEPKMFLHIDVKKDEGIGKHGDGYLSTTDKEPVSKEEGTF